MQVGGSGCPQRASMNRLPFCEVFNFWSPYRMELKNFASLDALTGSLAVELDVDIAILRVLLDWMTR